MTAITGNTFPVRVALRDMGGTWDAGKKAWMVPDEKADLARALLAVRHGERAQARPRRTSGSAGYRNRRYNFTPTGGGCRCEDYPCCGH